MAETASDRSRSGISLGERLLFYGVMFLLLLSIALLAVIRVDLEFRHAITVLLLQLEHEGGSEQPFLRTLTGITARNDPTTVQQLIVEGDSKKLGLLLIAGLNPNTIDQTGASLLHRAVQAGQFRLVQMLIAQGSNINQRAGDQSSPLMIAVSRDAPQLVQVLLQFGAESNIVMADGTTPLGLAIKNGSIRTIELLLQAGANPNQLSFEQKTPLMVAAGTGNVRSIELLDQYGANFDGRDPLGKSALGYAAAGGNSAAAEYISRKLRSSAEKASLTQKPASSSGNNSKKTDTTRLMVVGKPLGTWKRTPEGLLLTDAQLFIRNMGEEAARSVEVQLVLPGGEKLKLSGPNRLERKETKEYLARELGKQIFVEGEMLPEVSCENCR